MKLVISSDHAGYSLKEELRAVLTQAGHEMVDLGAYNTESSDYPDFAEKIGDAIKKGVVVVRSSRTNGGIVRRNIELNDDDLGTVASMQLIPTKARVLLQLALLKTNNKAKIQDYFNRY